MEGLEVVAAPTGKGVRVPSVLISGRLDPAIVARAGKRGVIAVVEKPVAVAPLVALLQAAPPQPR